MSSGPARRRVPLPRSGQLPRAGKLRLGESTPTGKTDSFGNAIVRPVALDYFRVVEDDSGITSGDAVRAFHAVYGDRPTELRCWLPGNTPEDVLEGAHRLYGSSKLKRRCDGETCDERTVTGGWETKPCVCAGLPEKSRDRCKLSYTFNVLLPDVEVVGVWQVETASEIGSRRLADWLDLMHRIRGDLALLEFTLGLVAVDVQVPKDDGTGAFSKSVYVLNPVASGASPRAMLEGAATQRAELEARREPMPALPAPDDETGTVYEGEAELSDDAVTAMEGKKRLAALVDSFADVADRDQVLAVLASVGADDPKLLTDHRLARAEAILTARRGPAAETDGQERLA